MNTCLLWRLEHTPFKIPPWSKPMGHSKVPIDRVTGVPFFPYSLILFNSRRNTTQRAAHTPQSTYPARPKELLLRFALEERQGKWGFLPERWGIRQAQTKSGGARGREDTATGSQNGLGGLGRVADGGKGMAGARRAYRRLWAITAVHHGCIVVFPYARGYATSSCLIRLR